MSENFAKIIRLVFLKALERFSDHIFIFIAIQFNLYAPINIDVSFPIRVLDRTHTYPKTYSIKHPIVIVK